MNREYYKLANAIDSSGVKLLRPHEQSDRGAGNKCRQDVLTVIRSEKNKRKRKHLMMTAACLAVIAVVTGIFHNEVQAAIERIRYSLSMALGKDVSDYSEDILASISKEGYIVTLQETIAAREELFISYTVQREDGRPIAAEDWTTMEAILFINGKRADGGSGGSFMHLDQEQTVLGCEIVFRLLDTDLARNNTYELKFKDLTDRRKESWDFTFEADGSELHAQTVSMPLETAYTLPDGSTLTLDELFINGFGEQITFHTSKEGLSMEFELRAYDDKGREAKFTITSFGTNKGVLENIYDREGPMEDSMRESGIGSDSKTLTAAVYAYELPKEGGQIRTDDAQPIGETVTWDLTKLK